MKFNIKSRKGFTLIELLVVIGILAVLAAIAIPSVAGLIDRANVSADNTNSNEMTNAMERFVSEYELYKQDIASGTLKDGNGDGVPDNMDAAQGRVYNVTKAITRADIEKLESETGFNGIRIDIDNKYAQNYATAKAVMQNYMKTSSSTFEPKQSDMTYWYNTVTGYTVVAEKDINTATLQYLLPQEVRYGNGQVASLTEWIDLSSDYNFPDIAYVHSEKTSKDGNPAIRFYFKFIKPYDTVNSKYIIIVKTKSGMEKDNGIFDINTAQGKIEATNIFHSTDKYDYRTLRLTEVPLDMEYYVRLCFEYTENGKTKYMYTPIIMTTYNDASEKPPQ